MGSESIDLSLNNIWKSWFLFRKGKKASRALDNYTSNLEHNLYQLYHDIKTDKYRHDQYRKVIVTDSKRRIISVANIRDRVVHRLLYEYLIEIYDRTFIYDAWSCRKNKGVISAIERTQEFFQRFSESYFWRADIKKFFDSVDHNILKRLLHYKISDAKALILLDEIINSYSTSNPRISERERELKMEFPLVI